MKKFAAILVCILFAGFSYGCNSGASESTVVESNNNVRETKKEVVETSSEYIKSLEIEVKDLNEQLEILQKDYSSLEKTHSSLEKDYSSLDKDYSSLEKDYLNYKEKMQPYEELEEAEIEARRIEAERIEQEEAEAEKARLEEEERLRAEKEAQGYNTGIRYEQLARTPDDYIGEKVKFTGEVIQVIETQDSNEVQLRLAVERNYSNILLLAYDKSIVSQRVLEDDNITIYGFSMGTITYKSTMGGDITIPAVSVDRIDFN